MHAEVDAKLPIYSLPMFKANPRNWLPFCQIYFLHSKKVATLKEVAKYWFKIALACSPNVGFQQKKHGMSSGLAHLEFFFCYKVS
jgi:hypothetical protein